MPHLFVEYLILSLNYFSHIKIPEIKNAFKISLDNLLANCQQRLVTQFLDLETNDDECTVCCSKLTLRPQQNYTYYQDTGKFVGGSGEWAIDTHGYSGNSEGRNDPTKQCIHSVGPAPVGQYNLTGCKDTMHNATVIRPCSF